MSQQQHIPALYTEANLQLAIASISSNQIPSVRRSAAIFNTPEATLRDRRAGRRCRADCEANSKRLTKVEEEVIVQ